MIVDVDINGGDWGPPGELERMIARAAQSTLEMTGIPVPEHAELSVLLTDRYYMKRLNEEWRSKPAPTNVLSFPIDGPSGPIVGDLVLAQEIIQDEANAEGKSFSHHFFHMIVHGLLHLLGYDHQLSSDAERMERMEAAILETLGVSDPYSSFEVLSEPAHGQ